MSEAQSQASLPKDHGLVVAQAHNLTSEPRSDHELHSRAVQVQTKPSGTRKTQSKAVRLEEPRLVSSQGHHKPPAEAKRLEEPRLILSQGHHKPPAEAKRLEEPRPFSSQGHHKPLADAKRLEEPGPSPYHNQPKPLASEDHHHGKHQTLSRSPRVDRAGNDSTHDSGKNKKTGVERTHHRNHTVEEDNVKRQSLEKKEKKMISRSVSAAATNDDDYALKYHLGLVPRRSNEPKRRSEYQRQFQWRNLEHNSPLMCASQVNN